jgi:filamin
MIRNTMFFKVGRLCTFTIDATNASAGDFKIFVNDGTKNMPNYAEKVSHAQFRVSFMPQEAREHTINVKFNGVPVPGNNIIYSKNTNLKIPYK